MAQGPTYRVKFRRRREGKTNYYRRRRLLLSRLPRLVVRKTNTNTIVQLVNASVVGDTTVASAISTELGNHGWTAGTGNIPAAYLTGFLAGLRAKSRGVKEAILDVGLNPPVKGSRVYAALKGAIDAGLDISHGKIDIPDQFISGQHIADWAKSAPSPTFSLYKKRKFDAVKITEHITQIKNELSKKVNK